HTHAQRRGPPQDEAAMDVSSERSGLRGLLGAGLGAGATAVRPFARALQRERLRATRTAEGAALGALDAVVRSRFAERAVDRVMASELAAHAVGRALAGPLVESVAVDLVR